jgi:hypothetical protein
MPAIIDDEWCEACRGNHTLCYTNSDELGPNREFEYRCPNTGRGVQFTWPGNTRHRVEPARPFGSVLIHPVT